ncbi:MAG: tetratricopeptide repeat protein [Candidatus Sumerlaeaceae bacterium]|nr:tetratricopeptide repeat protein [Candidatus Sumerlaeaceae bacterium]
MKSSFGLFMVFAINCALLPSPFPLCAQREPLVSASATTEAASLGIGNLPRPQLGVTTASAHFGREGIRLLESIGWCVDDFALFFDRSSLSPDEEKSIKARRHFWMGQFYLERNEYTHAEGQFRAALEYAPESLPIQLGLADALIGARQFDQAEKLLDEILSKHPESVHALIVKAQLAMSRAESATARRDQDKWLNVAIGALEKAKSIQPRNVDILKELVSAYTAKRDLDKLIETYKEITVADPKDTYAVYVLANLLAKRGQREEAAKLFEKVIEQRRSFVNAYVYLGLIQEELGQTTQAIETYKRALLIEPRNVQLQRLFDTLLSRVADGKNRATVLQEYERFAKEYPYSTEIQRLYADQLAREKLTTAAIAQYKRVLELDPENLDALLAVANLFAQQGSYDEAGEYYSRAMEVAPERQEIYEAIATTFANVKDRGRAIQVLKKALRFNPNIPMLYVNVASLLEQESRIAEARQILEDGIKKIGEKAEFYVALGEIAEHAKDSTEAIRAYRKACDLAPTNRLLVGRFFKLLAEKNKWDELEQYAQELADKYGDKGELFALAGETFLYEGELERAAKWFDKAMAEAPERFPLYARLVQIWNVRDNHERAFQVIEQAQKRFADNPDVERMLADTFVDAKQYDKAIPIYRKLVEKDPKKLDGYRLLVDALNKAGRYDEALSVVDEAMRAIGRNEETQLMRAIALFNQKRYEAAEAVLKELLKSHGKSRDVVYYLLGSIYLEQKRYDAAEGALKKAIEINPLNDSALNALGYMYAELGKKLDDAEKLINQALSVNPNAPHILDSLGWVYFRQGKTEEALQFIEKAWKLMGDDPEILKHLGDIHFKLGNRERAVEFWKRSLLLDSNQRDVRARIADIEKKTNK